MPTTPPDTPQAAAEPSDDGVLALLGIGCIDGTLSGEVSAMNRVARDVLGLGPQDHLVRIEASDGGPDPVRALVARGELPDMPCRLAIGAGRAAPVWLSGRVLGAGAAARVQWLVRHRRIELAGVDAYRDLFDAIDDGVVVHDIDSGRIVHANRAAQEMFGLGPEAGQACEPHDVSPKEPTAADREAQVRLQAAARGEPQVFEWEARDAAGRSFWLEVSLRRGSVGGVDRAVGVMRAVTDRKKAEASHREAEERLRSILHTTHEIVGMVGLGSDVTEQVRLEEELNEAQKIESLGLLAGGIAHDFNNILTAIVGGISLARRQAGDDSPLAELLSLSETACMRARDLTQQLLTISRGGAPICRPASMAELIRETARFVSSGSRVRCELDIDPELWLVDMDQSQMSQVLGNLVLNAIQAMPSGGTMSIEARNVDIGPEVPPGSASHAGRHVRVLVRDSGPGIRPDHALKIFDPYFTTKVGGSGLGLATSYSIVRRHKGHLDFESVPGEGATFRILLPAARQSSVPATASPAPPAPVRARVLIVDDEAVLREVGSLVLQTLGYEVDAVASGELAVERFEAVHVTPRVYDAVLMDLIMPGGMNGWQAARALRNIEPDVVIVASSGYSTDPVMADYKVYGFDGLVAGGAE